MNDFSLLIDDDSQFVLAINDELKSYYLKKKMDFYICQSRYDVEKSIEKKSGVGELIIAVLDMWFIDKEKNIAKEDEGYNILKILREHWKNSYIIILSGHINSRVKELLADYKNITIVEKPINSLTLIKIIDSIIDEIQDN